MNNEEKWLYYYDFENAQRLTDFVNDSGLKVQDIQSIAANRAGGYTLFIWSD